jgi:hypothetical protein
MDRLKLTILPVLRWGIFRIPLHWKFRRIPGGYEARRWYKRVLRAGV